jgi:ABC-type Zn uptake system ZnuABC Zn-binding protein ZnuA
MNKLTRMALAALLCGAAEADAAERLRVVATLSTFADLAKTIGGEHVEVAAIASPKFNPHFIEPKPSDVLKVKRAQLLIHAGLDLEAWRGPLLDAAGNRSVMPGGTNELDLSQGIELLEVPDRPLSRSEGDIHLYGNPHYWLDTENARIMAKAICDKLCELDADHCPLYRANRDAFIEALVRKLPEWRAALAPFKGAELIGDHRAWPYLMRFLGLKIEHHLEPKPGIPPTPRQIEFLEQYITQQRIPAIVRASYFPQGAAESLAKRTGAKVVWLCQSVGERPECSDYLAMTDYNVGQLVEALR